MVSIFGYANTFAAYLGLTTSLAIEQFIKSHKTKRILYGIYIVASSATIILTQSKFIIALIGFIILLFIINGIKNKKISSKWIVLGSVSLLFFAIYVFIAKDIGRPPIVTEKGKSCGIRTLDKNTKYEFQFDLQAETEKNDNSFKISVIEVTRYLSERTLSEFEFANYNGTKTVNIVTSKDLDHIEIRIENEYNQKIIISDFRINGKSFILEHKIIPEEVLRMFTMFNFKNSSVWQRGDYWKDCLKIIKNSGIIGSGGNTWRYSYGHVQDYLYYAKECHSYILEVTMSFGLLGIVSYIFVMFITIKNGVKHRRKMLPILIGISIIGLHSLIDFDMSYLIIEMVFFMFIAIINKDCNIKPKGTLKIEILVSIFMVIICVGNMLGLIAQCINDETGIKKSKIAPWFLEYQYSKIMYMNENASLNENTINYIKRFIKNEPYSSQVILYGIMSDCNLNGDDIQFLINTWKKVQIERPYDIENVRKRSDVMLKIAKKTTNKELKTEIAKIIEYEYNKNHLLFWDNAKNQTTELMCKYEYQYYTSNFYEALSLQEN